jgi:hypothetical protein
MKLPAGFLYQDAHRPKSPDASHLATVNRYACTEFWTNDDRLKQAAADGFTFQPHHISAKFKHTPPMRLTDNQIQAIRQSAHQIGGAQSNVRVFGSRLDDSARGGDLDPMLELPAPVDNPALMAAQLAARVSRALHGRKVDVVISAPNLMRLPIHDIAFQEGRLL